MHWIAVVVVFALTVGYLFIGAAVFRKLESDNEQETKTLSYATMREFMGNNTCVSADELEELIRHMVSLYKQGILATGNQSKSSADQWDWWSSFFFSATVVTTIGYGHISPSTQGGKIFCIFYAVVGIPLVGIFFAGIGQKLIFPIKQLRNRSDKKLVKTATSVLIALFGIGLLIFLPAWAFHHFEGWSFPDSIYYAVITLTTIGFGDFVPGRDERSYRAGYQVLTIVWIFIGLSWFAIVVTDISDIFKAKIEKRGTNVQRRKSHMSSSSKEFDAIRPKADSRVSRA